MHDDRFTGLQDHLRVKGAYYLESRPFPTASQFFRSARSGMWIILGKFRGYAHWIAFDAWNSALFEGENHVIASLAHSDLKAGADGLTQMLEHLELSDLHG